MYVLIFWLSLPVASVMVKDWCPGSTFFMVNILDTLGLVNVNWLFFPANATQVVSIFKLQTILMINIFSHVTDVIIKHMSVSFIPNTFFLKIE